MLVSATKKLKQSVRLLLEDSTAEASGTQCPQGTLRAYTLPTSWVL